MNKYIDKSKSWDDDRLLYELLIRRWKVYFGFCQTCIFNSEVPYLALVTTKSIHLELCLRFAQLFSSNDFRFERTIQLTHQILKSKHVKGVSKQVWEMYVPSYWISQCWKWMHVNDIVVSNIEHHEKLIFSVQFSKAKITYK